MALPTAVQDTTTGVNHKAWVVSTAIDADAGEVLVNHGLRAAPDIVALEILTAAGSLAGYFVSTKSATQIGVTKSLVGAGSGGANQLRVIGIYLHSIER
jgi:hypothetical protein